MELLKARLVLGTQCCLVLKGSIEPGKEQGSQWEETNMFRCSNAVTVFHRWDERGWPHPAIALGNYVTYGERKIQQSYETRVPQVMMMDDDDYYAGTRESHRVPILYDIISLLTVSHIS